ncbi:hypothetical protein EQO05_01000 [Methanosarcina sp. MSH10X1]|uniref:hypothetical protein n=1 Tax=Methanosarcina sp. MSH10X1 TaxID=2507075 RepID=UPI000FFB6BE9|nr:hypothetical protein [Methanosarcina sp. MSH10X1]RXA21846.1 hypothetical protein EQO05_01000 [Methanosarcina sp. MSH10X1]
MKFGGRLKESEKGLPNLANLSKPEIKKVDTREEISKVSGISHGNIDKIKEIKASAPAEVLSELEKKLITGVYYTCVYVRGGLGLQLEGFYKRKAEENLRLSGKLFGENHSKTQEGLLISTNPLKSEIKKVNTREELAKVSGVGSDTIFKIKEIKATAPAEVLSELEKKLITGVYVRVYVYGLGHRSIFTLDKAKNSHLTLYFLFLCEYPRSVNVLHFFNSALTYSLSLCF